MPSYVYCVIWSAIGMLLCAIGLSTILTLYLKDQSNQTTSMTTTTTVTTSTSTFVNQTNSSVTVKPRYSCDGVSSYTLWTLFGSLGITMNIDTSDCSFNSTPLYFVSLAGTGNQQYAAGYTAIYNTTKNSFAVYGRTTMSWTSAQLLNQSQISQWDVNWFGISK